MNQMADYRTNDMNEGDHRHGHMGSDLVEFQ